MLSIFSCVFYPSVCLLWRNVCLVLWPMFWLGRSLALSCMSCLYIFEIFCQLLSLLLFFSHFEGCIFTLLIVSFFVQKLLSLIRSHLYIVFISITQEVGHRESCCDLCQRVFWLCFSISALPKSTSLIFATAQGGQ